jgi:hypothetical protein
MRRFVQVDGTVSQEIGREFWISNDDGKCSAAAQCGKKHSKLENDIVARRSCFDSFAFGQVILGEEQNGEIIKLNELEEFRENVLAEFEDAAFPKIGSELPSELTFYFPSEVQCGGRGADEYRWFHGGLLVAL